jgi:hypothetical protein
VIADLPLRGRCPAGQRGLRGAEDYPSLRCRHAPPTPRPVCLPSGHCSLGKDGRPQARSSSKLCATLRPSVRRFLRSDPALFCLGSVCLFPARRGRSAPRGTSRQDLPAAMPRQHHGGGAGSSPRNHRHDWCSRWEELTGNMEERKRAWRNRQKKNAGSAEASGFRRPAGLIPSTFSPANPMRVMPVQISARRASKKSGSRNGVAR